MKFVALLSGGKDSCYNIVHCITNGHELIAAASLRSPPGQGEIDSFMYQTVGQDAIELVARALGVPLFRRTISGSAIEQGRDYGPREGRGHGMEDGVTGDETEDMFALLLEVKAAYPDIQGVSVGAILSNYQRVRVDHVCQRLSLTPLCYLWQRDQRQLMSEMIDAGVDAILIKVAGIGLETRHLGKTLTQMEPTFHKLHDLYGAHICGEGGEYETLTLDCPAFKRRIRITETRTIVHSDHAFATVAYLEIVGATVEEKPQCALPPPAIPPLLDEPALQIRGSCAGLEGKHSTDSTALITSQTVTIEPKIHVAGSWAYISNVQGDLPPKDSVEDEVFACFETIKDLLSSYDMHLKHITNTMLLLTSMNLFPEVNKAYSRYFGTSPPSRACVAVDLVPPTRIRLACVAFRDEQFESSLRTALHVQGVSYWAPANIGPYSQAITVRDQIFVSGQIGLIPAHMALPSSSSFAMEAALAFQHVDRIIVALKDGPMTAFQSVIIWVAGSERLEQGRCAWNAYSQSKDMHGVPAIIVAVKTLPRDAMIEVQVLAHSNRQPDQGETKNSTETSSSSPGVILEHYGLVVKSACDRSRYSTIVMRNRGVKDALRTAAASLEQVLSAQIFCGPSADGESISLALDGLACTRIPVRGILTPGGQAWDMALCLHHVP